MNRRPSILLLLLLAAGSASAGTPADFQKKISAASRQEPPPEGDFELGGSNGEFARLSRAKQDLAATFKVDIAPHANKLNALMERARLAGCLKNEMAEEVPDGCSALIDELRSTHITVLSRQAKHLDSTAELEGQMAKLEAARVRTAGRTVLYGSSAQTLCSSAGRSGAVLAVCKRIQQHIRLRTTSSNLSHRDLEMVLREEASLLRELVGTLETLRSLSGTNSIQLPLPGEPIAGPITTGPSDGYSLE